MVKVCFNCVKDILEWILSSRCVFCCVCVFFQLQLWDGCFVGVVAIVCSSWTLCSRVGRGVPPLLGGSSLVLFSCYSLLEVLCITMRSG